ncbi:hypothetical protein CANINC_001056 [Pichia inconspicua]|uniref:2-(3-amino-3-carboxypropyl)histidine synthase subunit 2 n=1 Tax=Pichia inconspicua TaxID=52247 RepID=A0A4T0X692_9ASCO|nr:hypothetical protein CANINC_001056 [[Candida] inconspicua]
MHEESTQAVVAPALSTAQDEMETFAKVDGLTDEILRLKRQHLGPEYYNNHQITYKETIDIIRKHYSLEKLAEFLNSRDDNGDLKYPLISLQFPDDLICDSTIVAQILQSTLNKWNKEFHDTHHDIEIPGEIDFTVEKSQTMSRDIESVEKTIESTSCGGDCGSKCKNRNKYYQDVWILADTSYSPCCIDEVAAEHVKADIVVHFGDACLTPVEKISSCYVLGRPYIDLSRLIQKFEETYSDKESKIVLMADASYSYVLPEMYETLKDQYLNLAISTIDFSKAGQNSKIIDGYQYKNNGSKPIHTANRIIYGISSSDIEEYMDTVDFEDENYIDSAKYDGLTQNYSLFHIGRPHDARVLLLTTKFGELKIIDPQNIELVHDQFPTLMKRYRNMQVTRSATTIGILINTLSLANTKVLLNQIIKDIIAAGKKHYMFVVGKPNVAKIANFECVDAWCIIGCGQSGIVIDMYGDYYKPIITPYELKLALMPMVTWTGKWVTDFDAYLNKSSSDEIDREEENTKNSGDSDDDFAPEFDPVTGKLKMNQPLRQLRHLELELELEISNKNIATEDISTESSLVKKFSNSLSVGKTISTSAYSLQNREWTGLGSDFAELDSTEGALVEEGRTGIARDYIDV